MGESSPAVFPQTFRRLSASFFRLFGTSPSQQKRGFLGFKRIPNPESGMLSARMLRALDGIQTLLLIRWHSSILVTDHPICDGTGGTEPIEPAGGQMKANEDPVASAEIQNVAVIALRARESRPVNTRISAVGLKTVGGIRKNFVRIMELSGQRRCARH